MKMADNESSVEIIEIIMVQIESGDSGLLHATSPQVPELFVSGENFDELFAAVTEVVGVIFSVNGDVDRNYKIEFQYLSGSVNLQPTS